MALDDAISRACRARQATVLRIACDPARYGLTLKGIAADSGVPYSTLRGYASGEVGMPFDAVFRLCEALPPDLLSLLLPDGLALVRSADACPDSFGAKCRDFTDALADARHPDSPGGVEITHGEADELARKRAGVR